MGDGPHLYGEQLAGPKRAPPPTPARGVPLKWAKSPRSSGVRSLSLGSEMGSKGELAGRAETGAGGWRKGIQIRYFPQIWGDVSYWSQIPQSYGWVWGALGVSKEGIKREWGALSPKMGLWGLRAGRPPPPSSGPGGAVTQELDTPAQLQARPPPPSVPKLRPRLRRSGPSSTHWHRPRGAGRGGPCALGYGEA